MQEKLTAKFGLSIESAEKQLKEIVRHTPLEYSHSLSQLFNANIYLKREDLQIVRSYKLRGAYNMISSLDPAVIERGVVCASAGNHAQGVAFSCNRLGIKGVIFMPKITPRQKIEQTKMFGNGFIEIVLEGDTFDDCAEAAKVYTDKHNMTFIPAFDHKKIIEGQGTVGLEILEDMNDKKIDFLFVPIGGGGLCSGVSTYFHDYSPDTEVIGVEPEGAACMKAAFEAGKPVMLDKIEKFVDGAAVKLSGELTYSICSQSIKRLCTVPEGEVCSTILRMYNKDAIVVEPAGALSITALNHFADEIEGKTVVCIISGSNNDINRMQEIKERSLLFEGLKHYFILRFPQRPGALKYFVNEVLSDRADITRFEYMKKNDKENGPALVGIEIDSPDEYDRLIERMTDYGLDFSPLDPESDLGRYIV